MARPTLTLNDGNEIPRIGFGVAGIRDFGHTVQMVRDALETGYQLIDNASIYENEHEAGIGLRRAGVNRDSVFLTSKVWPDMYGRDKVRQSFEASIKRLCVDKLDLFLLHWPAPELDLYVESWLELTELKKNGLVDSIGVSNFYPDQLTKLIEETGVTPVLNQIECHPYYQRAEERAFHRAHNIATQCWSPLGRSTCLGDPVIVEIALRTQRSPAQVVLTWAMDQDLLVIPRSRNFERMQENFDLEFFTLEPDDIARINTLDKGLEGRLGNDAKFTK